MKQSCLANSSQATSLFIQYLQVFEFTLGSCPISIISAFMCKSRMFCQSCWGWLSCLKCKHHPPALIHLGPAFIPRPYAHLPNPCGLSRVSEGPTADARCFSLFFLFFFEEAVEKKTIGHFRPSGVRWVLVTQIGPGTGGTVTVTSK